MASEIGAQEEGRREGGGGRREGREGRMWELRRRGLTFPLLIFLQPDLDYKCPRSVECQNVGVRRENGLKSY